MLHTLRKILLDEWEKALEMAENASKYATPGAIFLANSARFYCKPGYRKRKRTTGKSSDATENVSNRE